MYCLVLFSVIVSFVFTSCSSNLMFQGNLHIHNKIRMKYFPRIKYFKIHKKFCRAIFNFCSVLKNQCCHHHGRKLWCRRLKITTGNGVLVNATHIDLFRWHWFNSQRTHKIRAPNTEKPIFENLF